MACIEAWDVLPLDISDVAKATREDKVYGKLFNAVRGGNLDNKDKDLSKFKESSQTCILRMKYYIL